MDDRIDKYLQGEMSPEEKQYFEEDLHNNESLQNEYESTKLIADAIQRNALRNHLQSVEASSRKKKRSPFQAAIYYFALAACIGGILFDIGILRTSLFLKDKAADIYSGLETPVSRSANQIDELLQDAYVSIGSGNYNSAKECIEKVQTEVESGLQQSFGGDEITEYEHSIMLIQKQEAEWYSALIQLKQGKIKKSRKALKAILEGSGIYAEKAKQILDSKALL